jgi:uncharacterized protein (TIGR03663 family)
LRLKCGASLPPKAGYQSPVFRRGILKRHTISVNARVRGIDPMSADSPQIFLHGRNRSAEMEDPSGPWSHTPKWIRWAAFLLVALLGLLIRLPQLGVRPMHTDEAVNAYIVGQLLTGKAFAYDPLDRHGPVLAALALPLVRMQGAKTFSDLTEPELRLTTVLAGTLAILLFGAAVEMFGFLPCLIAALLFAGAPLPVYYDRYFIHESFFTCATFGLILAGWRGRRGISTRQAVLIAACAALMLASKETALLHFFVLAAVAIVFWRWNLRGKNLANLWRPKAALAAGAAFLLLTILLFTWFGCNWKALAALMQSVPNFLARAGGEGHQKPFWYFAHLLAGGWSGALILILACIGFFETVRKRDPSPYGFLAFYALFLAVIYSLIPYKTPWLALNFWLPIALFAGLTIQSLWCIPARSAGHRTAIRACCILAGAMAATLIAHDTHQRVFLHPADETNPYAYAHTSEDLLGLPEEIEKLAHQNAISAPSIAVIAADPWPLPWYLRHLREVGFWQPGQQPGDADFYITSTDAANQYANRLQSFRPEFFGVRPNVLILLWSPAPK